MAEDYIYEVERILARRRTRKGKLEYMVRWKTFGSEEDTWEPLENLGDCMELVEDFNQKTMKDGKFERLASLDSIHKKQSQGGKRKPNENGGKEKGGQEKGGPEKGGQGKGGPEKGGPEKGGQGKEKAINGSEKNKDYVKANSDHKTVSSNHRTNSSITVINTADLLAKAQKRKRESDLGGKQTNGPVALSSTHIVKSEGQSPEKRVKRAHSITGVGPQGTHSSGASNGLGSPLQRRRINSSISTEGFHHSTRGSPNLHRTMSVSAYPKLILSPTKITMATRRGGVPANLPGNLASSFTAPSGSTEEERELQGRRTASIVARRRLSQSSSTTDDTMDSRRSSARQSESLYRYKEIVVKKCQGYTQVRLFTTTPTRNALNLKALQELTNVFESSKKDDSKVIFLSGSGSVFCSGLDLRCIQTSSVEERKRASKNLADAVRAFVDSLINCPKLVVVAINGPAIGLGAAILPLCDIAYASDKAYFHLPYSILSQTPEGCASHTYPQVLGLAVAGEMLYAGRKLTALEACACGLVSHTFWPTSFMQEVVPRVQRIAAQSGKALLQSKLLVRGQMRAKLEYVNESECVALEERWRSPECHRQIKLFAENYSDM